MTGHEELDHELSAVRTAYGAIAGLPPEARPRALNWLLQRTEADEKAAMKAALVVGRFARKAGRLKP